MDILFTKYRLGRIELANHIVMSPMTRNRAVGNIPNQIMSEYYAQRSGAGLIITEGTSPSMNGLGYARIPVVFSMDQVSGWKKGAVLNPPDMPTFYTPGPKGYTDYPVMKKVGRLES